MKTFLFVLSLCAPLWLVGQTVDSSAIRHVDSLLKSAINLASDRELEKSTSIVNTAEKLILANEVDMGPESEIYGRCCVIRGYILKKQRNYTESEKWLLNAIAIQEKAIGRHNPHYAISLNTLATLYHQLGQYEKVEPLYLEVKAIRAELFGTNHSKYASILNNLAILYDDLGQYEKAEPLYLEVMRIRGSELGKEHPSYAASLNNLAGFYVTIGQYEKAESLYLEALDIREKALGKEHSDYATSLYNLARYYKRMNQYEKAELFYLEAISILGSKLGKEHPDYALCINSLAGLYKGLGQYEKAEPLYLEALSIREKAFGKEHPDYATSLNNLASLYGAMGLYTKAEFVFLETLKIRENIFGKDHPKYGSVLYNISNLYMEMGLYEKAGQPLIELAELDQALISKAASYLSQRELDNYLSRFLFHSSHTFSATPNIKSLNLTPTCFDNILFYKGFLLNAASYFNISAQSSPEAQDLSNQLKGYQRLLAAQYSRPSGERQGVDELEEKANIIEKELARTVSGYTEATRQATWAEVQAALKADEAALEFVRFNYKNPNSTDSILYVALVLRPGFVVPKYIPLFEENNLSALLDQRIGNQARQINVLYGNYKLYELLWQPLEKSLAGAQTVYFSPDGLLHRLNLQAIAISGGQILSDRYQLIRLNSTRQLVIPSSTKPAANDALVYGGIQYDMDADAIQNTNEYFLAFGMRSTRGGLDFQHIDSTRRIGYRSGGEGDTWDYLPFTEVEARLLQHDLQEAGTSVRVLSGFSATEESFKGIGRPSPRILHFATHGFFFPDPEKTIDGKHETEEELVFKMSDNPMIRSGLLLAGANYAWKSGQPLQTGMEDGILTAYEISQMDLSNTELAVLSACETGLGDIAGSEGVYGLQRAFKIAGTRYLLMSLWQVPDRETQELMTTFYRHWLKDGQSVPEAFQDTQQEMRARFKDPFLWAGFVLVE